MEPALCSQDGRAVKAHPEAASLGLAYHNAINYRVCGAEFASVPSDPPSSDTSKRSVNARIGLHPGYFAVDLHNLKRGP
jgi:hypothetical protein